MRFVLCVVLLLSLVGCLGIGGPTNVTTNVTQNNTTNITQSATNQTNQTMPSPWQRYAAQTFSFEYPADMEPEASPGIFTATSTLDGQTSEVLIVTWLNTSAVYGANQDEIFKDNPTKAASDLLSGDLVQDPAGVLDRAYDVGGTSTFSISRDAYVAEVPFKMRFAGFTSAYTGRALNLYIPERSTLVRVRIMALDPAVAEAIRNHFLLSFKVG